MSNQRFSWLVLLSAILIVAGCVAGTDAVESGEKAADTPDPQGGVIARDPVTGEPSGMLQEMPAMSLVWDLMPPPTKEDYKTSLLWVQEWLN